MKKLLLLSSLLLLSIHVKSSNHPYVAPYPTHAKRIVIAQQKNLIKNHTIAKQIATKVILAENNLNKYLIVKSSYEEQHNNSPYLLAHINKIIERQTNHLNFLVARKNKAEEIYLQSALTINSQPNA